MGIFQTIYSMGPQGKRLRDRKFDLMRTQGVYRIQAAQAAQDQDIEETQRGRAFLGQALAGRGLSKSSIAEQDTARYDKMAERRAAALSNAVTLAHKNYRYVKAAIKYERKSQYAVMLDSLMSVFMGIGQGGTNASQGFEQPSQGGGYSSQDYYGFTPGQGY